MIKMTHKIKSTLVALGLLSVVVLLYACDKLESDVKPDGPPAQLLKKEFHILTDGTAYIDLQSIVKSHATVRVDVSSQPHKGKISKVGGGVLRYSPDEDFKKGRDSFGVSFFNENNELLLTDSVVIIVEDSTLAPCGYYSRDEWIWTSGEYFYHDVLANDFICGDTSDLIVEIFKPSSNSAPHLGTATVNHNTITYIPQLGDMAIHTIDTVVYKILKASDKSVIGYSTLHLDIRCDNGKNISGVSIPPKAPRVGMDSVWLSIPTNGKGAVVRCGITYDKFALTDQPKNGKAVFYTKENESAIILYIYERTEPFQMFTDIINYRVCNEQTCLDGIGYVEVN